MNKRRWIVSLLIVSLISGILGSLFTSAMIDKRFDTFDGDSGDKKNQQIVVDDSSKEQNIYQAVAKKATPSVVGITTTAIDRNNIFDIGVETQNIGTGVIVDSKGFILTNSHVIQDGNYKNVNVLFNDGSTTDGKVIWNDPTLDLAVVKVNKKNLVAADLGDSDKVQVGDIAIAIGNPLGLDLQKTVTQGIISGLNRTITTEKANKMTGLIQTDASINSGNSGGPLLNQYGQVIGINTAKSQQGEGLGFAIPINTAKKIVKTIINKGGYEKVVLGIRGIDLKFYNAAIGKTDSDASGIYVKDVVPDSAAQKAGIRADDIIIKLGKSDIETMSDLEKELYNYSKGSKTTIVVLRNNREVKLDIEFR